MIPGYTEGLGVRIKKVEMKNLGSLTIAAVLALAAGCASTPKPVPSPPKPAPVAAPAPVTVAPRPPTVLLKRTSPPAMARLSAGATTAIVFDGSTFALQYHGDDNGVGLREYFFGTESSKAWTRLVELLVYPTAGKGITPAAYAVQVAEGYKTTYPYAHYTEHVNKANGTATLDFTAWTDASLQAHYLEYNVFKFFPAQKGGNLVGFHFVEKIYTDPKATTEQNSADIAAIKQKVLLELAKVPLYRE